MAAPKNDAVIDHLTHAAESLQAAYELARQQGREDAAAIIRRAGQLTGSSIQAVISPLEPAQEVRS